MLEIDRGVILPTFPLRIILPTTYDASRAKVEYGGISILSGIE